MARTYRQNVTDAPTLTATTAADTMGNGGQNGQGVWLYSRINTNAGKFRVLFISAARYDQNYSKALGYDVVQFFIDRILQRTLQADPNILR